MSFFTERQSVSKNHSHTEKWIIQFKSIETISTIEIIECLKFELIRIFLKNNINQPIPTNYKTNNTILILKEKNGNVDFVIFLLSCYIFDQKESKIHAKEM